MKRAASIKAVSSDVRKKSHKINQGWFGRCVGGVRTCGGPGACKGAPKDSRGLGDDDEI